MKGTLGEAPPQPPPSAGPPARSWSLTQARELAHLRRAAGELLLSRQGAADGAQPAGTADESRFLLVLSELATNALKYGAEPITVTLHPHDAGWLIQVRDANGDQPPVPRPPDPRRIGGNGLLILDAASTTWGWYRDPDNERFKRVWALVPVD